MLIGIWEEVEDDSVNCCSSQKEGDQAGEFAELINKKYLL